MSDLNTIIAWLQFFGPFLLAVVLIAVGYRMLGQLKERKEARKLMGYYSLRPHILSRDEAAFFESLNVVVGSKFTTFSKVRLADIFATENGKQYFQALNRITQKHVDYLLCDPETFEPVMGIELDDDSHDREDRIERDTFVNELFQSAGLKLLRVPSARKYVPEELAAQIKSLLRENPA
jgi:very-short-patch-repair endonuclease